MLSMTRLPYTLVFEPVATVQFANPGGNEPHMDPMSDSSIWFLPSLTEKDHEKELLKKKGAEKNFKRPLKFSDISDQQLQNYAGILIPGGAFLPYASLHMLCFSSRHPCRGMAVGLHGTY